MTNLWKVCFAAMLAACLAAPAQAQDDEEPSLLCRILPFLCPDPPVGGVTQADLDALEAELQAKIDAQAGQISVQGQAIAALQTKDAAQDAKIAALEQALSELADSTVGCEVLGPAYDVCAGACVNTDANDDHCGSCGTACGPNQQCDGGFCGPKLCPNLPGDPDGFCNDAIIAADGTCHYAPNNTQNNNSCNDGNGCTRPQRTRCVLAEGATSATCTVVEAGTRGASGFATSCPFGSTCTSTGDNTFDCDP